MRLFCFAQGDSHFCDEIGVAGCRICLLQIESARRRSLQELTPNDPTRVVQSAPWVSGHNSATKVETPFLQRERSGTVLRMCHESGTSKMLATLIWAKMAWTVQLTSQNSLLSDARQPANSSLCTLHSALCT